jgi:hypothetical protein
MNYSTFPNISGREKVEKFSQLTEYLSGESEDFISLFCLWEYFQKEMEQDEVQETADVTIQNRNKLLEPSRKVSEVSKVTHDRKKVMVADHDRNLGTRTPKEDDSRKRLQAERYSRVEQSMSGRASCVARVVHTEPMDDFLMWPDTPTMRRQKTE